MEMRLEHLRSVPIAELPACRPGGGTGGRPAREVYVSDFSEIRQEERRRQSSSSAAEIGSISQVPGRRRRGTFVGRDG